MPDEPRVSAVIVVVSRARDVGACLESLIAQDEPHWEAIVVLNGATDEARRCVEGWASREPRIRAVVTPTLSASQARNVGLVEARAPLLYFLDDDVIVPRGGISAVTRVFEEHPEIAIAGGPNLTPPDDPPFARISGDLLGTRFGSGIARPRYRSAASHPARERDLTLCNLAARRSLFQSGFGFPVLFGGEENVMMGQASHGGHRLWYAPELWVHHRRRPTLPEFLAQMFRYGSGRSNALRSAPGTFHPAYFVPLLFVAYLASLPLLPGALPVSLAPLSIYGVFAVTTAVGVALRTRLWAASLALCPPLLLGMHVAYALGLAHGLARGVRADMRRFARNTPRAG